MASPKKKHIGRKILIGVLIFLVIAGTAFHIFITRYLPPLVKKRLSEIIVNGSDSLYQFEVGKFDLSFWGGSVRFSDLHIKIDSNVYKRMEGTKKLPPMTSEIVLQKGRINGIGLRSLIFSKKIDIREIVFDSADVSIARHFKASDEQPDYGEPLWKLIRPRIKSIHIAAIYCADLKMKYRNIVSAAAFKWEFEKSNILLSDIRVDSASTYDSSRLMFAKNIVFNADKIKLKTTDGLYSLQAGSVMYASASQLMEIKQFEFVPAVSEQQLEQHYGFQHESYKIRTPFMRLTNFKLPQWVTYNRLQTDTVELASPSIAIYLDRNVRPNPYSKKGGYPQQLLQKLPFLLQVKRLKATDALVAYTEKSNVTNLPGKVSFNVSGVIDNITNDPVALQRSAECVADIRGTAMNKGSLNTVFRFNLNDRKGAFSVKATITHLDEKELKPVFTAMTAVEMQSFNMQRLDYSMTGNEDAGTGDLSMKYGDMDILINKVGADKTFDRKGFLSFLANRLVIYKENPMNGEERKASSIRVERDATRSFFNLVWKTMFASAGEIVLRPMAQRKIERKKEREERRQERQNTGKK